MDSNPLSRHSVRKFRLLGAKKLCLIVIQCKWLIAYVYKTGLDNFSHMWIFILPIYQSSKMITRSCSTWLHTKARHSFPVYMHTLTIAKTFKKSGTLYRTFSNKQTFCIDNSLSYYFYFVHKKTKIHHLTSDLQPVKVFSRLIVKLLFKSFLSW